MAENLTGHDTSKAEPAGAKVRYTTISGVPVQPVYSPEDLDDFRPEMELGTPSVPALAYSSKNTREYSPGPAALKTILSLQSLGLSNLPL